MMVNIMSSDCGDLLLSLSEATLYPKQAHLFSFELFLVLGKVTKFLVEKFSTSEVISRKPHGGTPPVPSGLIYMLMSTIAPLCAID